jgi:hypothetical protein
MDIRTYVQKETSELGERLAKASAEAIASAEKRFAEDAAKAAEAHRAEVKRAVDAQRGEAHKAAEAHKALEAAHKTLEAERAEARKAAEAHHAEAQKAADALRAELQTAAKQKMAVAASLKEAQTQVESVRADLKNATDRGEVASRQLADARKANEKLEAARDDLTRARDELASARAAAESELHKTREALGAARAEGSLSAKKLEELAAEKASHEEAASVAHSASQAAEAKLAAVTELFKQSGAKVKLLERAQQDSDRKVAALEARLHEATPASGAPSVSPLPVFDDLLAGFQALGSATTIADVLTTLVEQLAAQFPRVALFRVKKSHLQGEHQIGFDLKTDIAKVVIPLGMDSLLARAASSGQTERLSAEELAETNGAPFSGSPLSALALPLMVAGEPLAIVYADDSGAAPANSADMMDINVRFAEVMQQHAAALLARLSNELKALAELQAYAASLVHELEQMHTADVQTGIGADELKKRLTGNLDYARSIYASRIALEGADAAGLLDDQLASIIEEQHDTPFGRDLALVVGRPALSARDAAEAS